MSDISIRRMDRPILLAAIKYSVYRILKSIGFATPFVVIFLVGNGVTYTDIALGTSAMAVVVIITEVPSGYVGDRIGRKRMIILGQVFGALGATGYLYAQSTLSVVTLYVAFGLATSLHSGSDLAWFYDSLKEHGGEDKYAEIESKFGSIVNYVKALSMIGGAGLFLIDPYLAILAGAVGNWLALLVIFTFPKNADYGDATRVSPTEAATLTMNFIKNSAVRTIVLLGALYAGAMYASSKFIQPTTLDVLPDAGVTVGAIVVPSEILLAMVYAAYALVSGVAVSSGARSKDRFGVGGTVVLAYGAGALCMTLPLVAPPLALPAMVAFMTIPSLAAPATGAYLNEHTGSRARATVMSAVSFVQAIIRIPILLGSGLIADVQTPTIAMAVVGGVVIVLGGLAILIDRPLTAPSPKAEMASG